MENWLSSMKRKFPEEDEFAWNGQHISSPNSNLNICLDRSPMGRYDDDPKASKQVRLDGGNGHEEQPVRRGRVEEDLVHCAEVDVDPKALKKAFLKFAKKINESAAVRKNYLENGKERPLQCIVCGRFDFISLLIMMYSGKCWFSIPFAYGCGLCVFVHFLNVQQIFSFLITLCLLCCNLDLLPFIAC